MNIYELLSLLDSRKIHYTLSRRRHDAISVDVTLVGERMEIDAFEDGHTEVSRSFGDEEIVGEVELFIQTLLK